MGGKGREQEVERRGGESKEEEKDKTACITILGFLAFRTHDIALISLNMSDTM